MAPTEDAAEGLGLPIQDLEAYFYANDGLVISTQLERLQRVLGVLTGLFNRVGLRMNRRKTISIVYFHATHLAK